MDQDAFSVLLSSQSQSAKRRRSTDQKDKYAACPICGTSIPKAFLPSHTEDCLGRSVKPSQPSQQRKVQKTDSTPTATAADASSLSPVKPQSSQPLGLLVKQSPVEQSPVEQSPTQRSPAKRSPAGQSPAKRSPAKQTAAGACSDGSPRPFLSPKQRHPPGEFRAMVSAGWDKALVNIPEALEEPATVQQQQMPVPQQQQQQQQQRSPPQQQQQGVPPKQQQQQRPPPQQQQKGAPPQQQLQQRSPSQPQPQQAQQQSIHGASPSNPADPAKPCATADAGGAVDAFAVLRSAQSAQLPMHAELFLLGTPSGSWQCHWRLAGAVWASAAVPEEPAWTATINNITLPQQQHAAPPLATAAAAGSSSSGSKRGSVKLRLDISTNIPSGLGTLVDWDNPLLPSNGLSLGAEGYCAQEFVQDEADAQLWSSQQQQEDEEQDGEDMDVDTAEAAAAAAAAAAAGSSGSRSSGSGSSAMRWRGGGPGVLISALQKCVRRGLAASATRIALELLKDPDGAVKLTRRLSIICLEDGLLHPQLPFVVWTMMALSRGYVIGGHLANALLSISQQMAAVGQRDFVPYDLPTAGPEAGVYTAPTTWHEVDAALGASSQESILVKSMLIRAAYGGMSGDRDMLLSYSGIWTARFSGYTLPPPPPAASPAAAADPLPAAAADAGAAATADAGPGAAAEAAAEAAVEAQAEADAEATQGLGPAAAEAAAGGPGASAPAQQPQPQQGSNCHIAQQEQLHFGAQLTSQQVTGEAAGLSDPQHHGEWGEQEQQQQASQDQQQEQEQEQQHEGMVQPQSCPEVAAQQAVLQPVAVMKQQEPEQKQEQWQQQEQHEHQQQAIPKQTVGNKERLQQQQQEQQPTPTQPCSSHLCSPCCSPGQQDHYKEARAQGTRAQGTCSSSPQLGNPAIGAAQVRQTPQDTQPVSCHETDQLCSPPSNAAAQQQHSEWPQGTCSSSPQLGSPPCNAEQPGEAAQGVRFHSLQPGSPASSAEQLSEHSPGSPGSPHTQFSSPLLCQPQQVLLGKPADALPCPSNDAFEPAVAVSPQPPDVFTHADAITHMDVLCSSQSRPAVNSSPAAARRVGCSSNSSRRAPGGCSSREARGGCSSREARGGCSSVWLQYLQQQYSRLGALEPTRVTAVGSLNREDIPMAAIDFHVAPNITHHLCDLPQLQEAARCMVAAKTAAAAQLSVPGGFQELVNSAIWQFRSSKNTKTWLQTQYLQAAAAVRQQGQAAPGSRAHLEEAAAAAVAAWSVPGTLAGTCSDSSGVGGSPHKQIAASSLEAASVLHLRANRAAAPAAAAGGAAPVVLDVGSPQSAAAVPVSGADGVAAPAAGVARGGVDGGSDRPLLLQPGSGFSEGALRVLELELSSLAAFESEQRRRRVELVPLLRPLAPAADAWCCEYLRKRLY